MSATLQQIRDGIRANLATVFSTGWAVSAYFVSSTMEPTIDMLTGPVVYDLAMHDGAHDVTVKVRARVPATEDAIMQTALDALVDPTSASSVKKAIETDKTLGGVVAWCRVTEASEPRLYQTDASVGSIGVEFTVQVQT